MIPLRSKRIYVLLLTGIMSAAVAILCSASSLAAFGVPENTAQPETGGQDRNNGESELEDEIIRQSESLDLSQWEEYFSIAKSEFGSEFDYNAIKSMLADYALSGVGARPDEIYKMITDLLGGQLKAALPAMTGIIGIALLTGLCGAMLDTSERSGMKSALMLILCALNILLITALFSDMAAKASGTVEQIAGFSSAAAPVLATLLTAMGCEMSAGAYSPLMAFLSSGVIALVAGVIIPMALTLGVLSVIDGLTQRVRLGRAAALLKKTIKWIIGLMSTLYLGIASIQGLSANAVDGVSIRTAKYALDKLIPAVGGMISGSMDTVSGCSLLLKNAAGIASIVILFALILKPLVYLIGGMFAFKAAAAVCEPFSDSRIPKMLEGVSDAVSFLFAAVAAAGCMFVITAGLIVSTGNMIIG